MDWFLVWHAFARSWSGVCQKLVSNLVRSWSEVGQKMSRRRWEGRHTVFV